MPTFTRLLNRQLKNFKLFIVISLISALLFSCVKDNDPVIIIPPQVPRLDDIFDISKVTHITLEISTVEWNCLLTSFDINPANEEYVLADFNINGGNSDIDLDSIGIRIRGNTSRRRPEGEEGEPHNRIAPDWHHAHFALNFKKYRSNQRYNNLEKINLKWFKDDANYVREVYCYDLFERFGVWTAPKSSYCILTIKIKEDNKSAYFGVYQMVESVDEDYLANRMNSFEGVGGNLWKCSWGASLRYPDRNIMGVENITPDPNTMQTFTYDLKTNKKALEPAKDELSEFISDFTLKTGEDFKNWVNGKIDIPLLLRTYAVNVMVGMWDDYWANTNNYYMYFDSDGKFYFIPYDYDNTLGTSLLMDSGTQDFLHWGDVNNPLIRKIINIPEYRKMYIGFLHELVAEDNDYFYAPKSIVRIENWQNMIRQNVPNDTGEDMFIGDFPANWGNKPDYRLNAASDNFFTIRSSHLPPIN
jgi:spore coat protein CotH